MATVSKKETRILVKDKSGIFSNLPSVGRGIHFIYKYQDKEVSALTEAYKAEFDALLYIPEELDTIGIVQSIAFYTKEQLGVPTELLLEDLLEDKLENHNFKNADINISREQLAALRPDIELQKEIAGKTAKEGSSYVAMALGYIGGFGIYIILLIYGTMVMKGVMEEKTTRIVEVIMSSVKPIQLMLGKIIGIAGVGITQLTLWGVLILIIQFIIGIVFAPELIELQSASALPAGEMDKQTQTISRVLASLGEYNWAMLLLQMLFYFVGGYLLYAALFAAVGSLVNDDAGDVQVFSFPVTIPIIISIFIMLTVVQQPNTSLAFWASIIPFSSPIVMPARIPYGVPAWELVLSMTLLVAGFIFTTWFAGKIYRTGILLYGKKIKPGEVLKWVFHKN